jgi:hypothetical protein
LLTVFTASVHLLAASACHQRHNLLWPRLHDCTCTSLGIPAAIRLPPWFLPHARRPRYYTLLRMCYAPSTDKRRPAPRLAFPVPSSSHLRAIRPDELRTCAPR